MSISVFYTEGEAPSLHSQPQDKSQECALVYLNEGGANFVFRILPAADGQELPSQLQGKLLRLRKDLPHVQSAVEQLTAFDEHFKPLFPTSNVVQFEVVELDEGISNRINAKLKDIHRPAHRRHDFLPIEDRYGLLVTDMTPGDDDILLQLKPKWLTQSPNAPQGAKRCRTCALRARRASQQVRTATDAQQSCPLALINDSLEERKMSAQSITSDDDLQQHLIRDTQPLLQKLRFWQSELDPRGILGVEHQDSKLEICKAMTLRDCTLFLKRSGNQIEARFADLDLKQPEKLATWRKVEKDLIAGGWYTNTEHDTDWSEEKVCLLSRESGS